ncbi:hypothetical protein A0J61_10689 [Choanephora cucurbitarum]|uniref:ISXO2-like transposase domain-containing protein n=1 Tax=Choanephora cucurbitarum TaxID=101091 RepID=A0A1C7MWS7_9FUNG|nr:hypothetical protein A0J61_10689 [Choanephora cucurbitarum]
MSTTNTTNGFTIASDIEDNITFTDEPVSDHDDHSFVPESDMSVSNTARLSEGNNSTTMEAIIGQPVADVQDVDIVHVGSANVEDVEQEDVPELDTLLKDESTSTLDESDSVDYWSNRVVVPVMNNREFFSTFRTVELCQNYFLNMGVIFNQDQPPRYGSDGAGSIMYLSTSGTRTRWRLEIDKSKFGTRKHFRGHYVGGVWVVGGVKRTPQRRCFLVVVPDCSARTLLSIIEEFVLPGSTVHTDC